MDEVYAEKHLCGLEEISDVVYFAMTSGKQTIVDGKAGRFGCDVYVKEKDESPEVSIPRSTLISRAKMFPYRISTLYHKIFGRTQNA